jgi:peptide/nickel transport system substrate-binding protein
MKNGKLIGIIALVALAALLVAFGPAPEDSGGANTLRMTAQTGPDSLDPGVSWMSASWTLQVNVYNGLLTFKKETGVAGTELVPDIAAEMPEISADGKTLSFKVRDNVNFGPPANRPVKPSDLKYTFDRLAKIPSQGVGFFSVIDGFDEVVEAGHDSKASVRGVVADDEAMTITFHLTRPDATFLYSLALPFSFAVPKGTAAEDLSMKTRTAPTGPYMFSDYDPQRGVEMKRNPAFKQWTEDSPEGNVDEIKITFGVSPDNAITRIMQGSSDAAQTPIPRANLLFLETSDKWKPFLHYHEQSRIGYIWMNSTTAPFDNVKVRQAVNWAINRRAFVKIGGGSGTPTSQILPPAIAGHTGHDLYPKQDMKKAAQLIKESGITPGEITIWCSTVPPNPDYAQYLQEVLRQLGFKARTRCVDGSAYYNLVGVKKNNTQIGFGGWGADYPEGATFIYSNLYGANINPDHSNNLAWYTGQDKEIEHVMSMMDLEERATEWGKIDTKLQEEAPWAPISVGVQRNLLGTRVGGYVFHPLYDFLLMKATVDGKGTNNSKTHATEVGYDDEGNPVEPGAEVEGEGGEDS